MNKKYTENEIEDVLRNVSKNLSPDVRHFESVLKRLENIVPETAVPLRAQKFSIPSIYTHRFSYSMMGAFTVFVFMFIGYTSLNKSTLNESTVAIADGVLLEAPKDQTQNKAHSGAVALNNDTNITATRVSTESISFKSTTQANESSKIASTINIELNAESSAHEDLFALMPGI